MRLKELATRSETSVASIKFYLREGLLRPGRAVTATLAEYDDTHLERLRLIGALRRIVGLSIDDTRSLVSRIDDSDQPLREVLGHAQLLALGRVGAGPGDAARAAGGEPEAVTRLIEARGWVHADAVREALAGQVAWMTSLGIDVTDEVLKTYADAADLVAGLDLRNVAAAESRDEAVLVTAVGVYAYGALLLRLVAVAQAAHAQP